MSLENYSDKKEYESLTPEQNAILDEINHILKKNISTEAWIKRNHKIILFGEKLSKKGFEMSKYILWHRVINSTPPENTPKFDTPDHDIERFIKSLEK